MKKDLRISVLADIYGDLLTDKQKDALELYYNQDFSLAEIAEDLEISRQGVRDSVKRGEETLLDLESKLGVEQRMHDYDAILEKLKAMTEDIIHECKSVSYSRGISAKAERLLVEIENSRDLFE